MDEQTVRKRGGCEYDAWVRLDDGSRMVRRIGAQPRIERKELEWSKDERQNSD